MNASEPIDVVREILLTQLNMVLELFLDKFRLEPEIIGLCLHHYFKEYCVWLRSEETGIYTLHTTKLRDKSIAEVGNVPDWEFYPIWDDAFHDDDTMFGDIPVSEVKEAVGLLNFDDLHDECVKEYSKSYFRRAYYSFRGSRNFNLDDDTRAIVMNGFTCVMISMILYDVYMQITSNSGNIDDHGFCRLAIPGFGNFAKNPMLYGVFANTMSRYIGGVAGGWNIRYYMVLRPLLREYRGKKIFECIGHIRSMDDQDGFEHAHIPKFVFPTVYPDFEVDKRRPF